MGSKAVISKKDERCLHTKSGNRCAMCKIVLVETNKAQSTCIGENAHIYGEKPGAARYDKMQPESFVNSEQNLIFLCCNCHKKIDSSPNDYPASKLFDLKATHEQWVEEQLKENSISYTCAEVEVLANYLISNASTINGPISYSLLKISEKIEKNSLQYMNNYISMGLINTETIEDYLNRNPDSTFATRLTNSIVKKYNELKSQKLDSCSIFTELMKFASNGNNDFKYQAAGLGILAYFFEKCEVFEK